MQKFNLPLNFYWQKGVTFNPWIFVLLHRIIKQRNGRIENTPGTGNREDWKAAQGDGGLVRHTKAAVRIAYELLSDECLCKGYSDIDRDLIIIGLIMHDSCKYGLIKGKYTLVNHPMIAAKLIRDNKDKLTLTDDELNLLCGMIEAHMGPFNKDFNGNVMMPLPKNKYEQFVHMCDLLASKRFLDIKFTNDEIVE